MRTATMTHLGLVAALSEWAKGRPDSSRGHDHQSRSGMKHYATRRLATGHARGPNLTTTGGCPPKFELIPLVVGPSFPGLVEVRFQSCSRCREEPTKLEPSGSPHL